MQCLSDIGEISLIKHLCSKLSMGSNVKTGPGDDCAVVTAENNSKLDILLTSDPVTQNIHFMPDADPEAIGHKAVGRVLSDIAAMGGNPLWVLLNTSAPKETPLNTADGIIKGAAALTEKFGASIVGGDISEGPTLSINAFAVGQVSKGKAILRSGASDGDVIFVTGTLGNSIKGKHISFIPRIEEGLYLQRKASSGIDVTDGLLMDLKRILEASNAGATLDLNAIPLSRDALDAKDDKTPIEHALTDGEDFELLFTLPKQVKDSVISEWNKTSLASCTEIGTIKASPGIEYIGSYDSIDLEKLSGYLHF
ncbi:thiamine-phosphate kinase [bacterium B17]|nr:thiamine-phosphate kinase [bacterium B17]